MSGSFLAAIVHVALLAITGYAVGFMLAALAHYLWNRP